MPNVALLFGYGQYPSGELLPQSKSRCDAAIAAYFRGEIDEIYITCFIKANGVLISDKMRQYLLENNVQNPRIITAPGGTNTAGEIDAFLSLISPSDQVFAVSNYYHLPRIIFLFLARRIYPSAIGNNEDTSWADLRIEPIKFLNSLLRPFSSAKRI